MDILFINACVREESRTLRLARRFLSSLSGETVCRDLNQSPAKPLLRESLKLRDEHLKSMPADAPDLKDARQFAKADLIVIAAPYWDLSFPALLKEYIEAINCVGITFDYNEQGFPYGLCRAKHLVYITTAGGPILSDQYGFGYVDRLCKTFYGIEHTHLLKAQGLDIYGADVPAILEKAEMQADELAASL